MLQGGEIIIILLVALVVLGPQRLPEVARKIGRWSAELRQAARELRSGLEKEAAELRDVAETLIEDGAAACVNVLPGLTSFYRWQGETHADPELQLIIKTTDEAYPRAEQLIRDLHPYELPEIIAVPVVRGLSGYLHWMREQTSAHK